MSIEKSESTSEIIKKMRRRYYELIERHSKFKTAKSLMRQSWVKSTIDRVEAAKQKTIGMEKLSVDDKTAIKNYSVLRALNDSNVLAIKDNNSKTVSEKIVIPLEITFQTVLRAHLETCHGSCYDMLEWLQRAQYAIAQICSPILREACKSISNECIEGHYNWEFILNLPSNIEPILTDTEPVKTGTELATTSTAPVKTSTEQDITSKEPITINEDQDTTEELVSSISPPATTRRRIKVTSLYKAMNSSNTTLCSPNILNSSNTNIIEIKPAKWETALVTILDMTSIPDRSFQHLLVYKDWNTNFIQLRPITDENITEEVSLELVKIFCDFTPPKYLFVRTDLKQLFEEVLFRLNQVFKPMISLHSSDDDEMGMTVPIVESKINAWMNNESSDAWSIGCNFVQWQINNTKNQDRTPYETFFGILHNGRAKSNYKTVDNKSNNSTEPQADNKKRKTQKTTAKAKQKHTTKLDKQKYITRKDTQKDTGIQKYITKTDTQNDNIKIDIQRDITKRDTQKDAIKTDDINATYRQATNIEERQSIKFDSLDSIVNTAIMKSYNQSNVNIIKNETETQEKPLSSVEKLFPNLREHEEIDSITSETELEEDFTIKYVPENKEQGNEEDFRLKLDAETEDQENEKVERSIESKPDNKDDEDITTYTFYICNTCKLVIDTDVRFCLVCKKSLHQYCGAIKMIRKDVMKSVCFVCL